MQSLTYFLLFLVALVLIVVSFPLGLIWTIGYSIRLGAPRAVVAYWGEAALASALAIDQLGNVVGRDLLNYACIRGADRYEFGNYRETISAVLGHNKRLGTLTDAGRGLANLLNWIDRTPYHVERAAGWVPTATEQHPTW